MNYCKYCLEPFDDNTTVCYKCQDEISKVIPAHCLVPGTMLNGRYRLGKVLGEGGFGITYVGLDTKLNMKVAVKEYYPNGLANRNNSFSPSVNCSVSGDKEAVFLKFREKFLTEARTLAKFSKEKSIVEVRDFFEANNTAYIIMEYLEGHDLKEHLRSNGVMSVEKTIQILTPIMQTLSKIHNQGLIHRDISPDNIRLTPDGVKLLDFGAAREMTTQSNRSISVMLKPGYAPEEQYRSKGIQGPWTDVYAVCATIYKCITGVTPDDSTQRVYKDELRKPSELGAKIHPSVEAVLLKGMAILQDDRYKNMIELMNAFSQAMTQNNVGCNGNTAGFGTQQHASVSSVNNHNANPQPPRQVPPSQQNFNSGSFSTAGQQQGNPPNTYRPVPNGQFSQPYPPVQSVNVAGNSFNLPTPPAPPKKNYTPFIIIIVAAILIIAIGVTVVLISQQESPKSSPSQKETTSQIETTTEAPLSLDNAENVAFEIFDATVDFDMKRINSYEILEWSSLENAVDELLIYEFDATSKEQAYEYASEAFGVNVNNAQELLDYLYSDDEIISYYQDTYGSDFKTEFSNVTSDTISAEDAETYIKKTKNEIDRFNNHGLYSDDINWDSIEDYAKVEFSVIYSGSDLEETLDYMVILGYINNEWKVVYFEENSDPLYQPSLTFIEVLFE